MEAIFKQWDSYGKVCLPNKEEVSKVDFQQYFQSVGQRISQEQEECSHKKQQIEVLQKECDQLTQENEKLHQEMARYKKEKERHEEIEKKQKLLATIQKIKNFAIKNSMNVIHE